MVEIVLSISNSDFTKLIYKTTLLLFIILLTVGYAEYRLRERAVHSGEYASYMFRYEEIFEGKEKADIIILGDSTVAHGIIPSYLAIPGYRAYNFGFNGAPPSFVNDLYTSLILKYYTRPKIIIYSVSPGMFNSNRYWRKISQDYKYYPLLSSLSLKDAAKTFLGRFFITHEDCLLKALIYSKAKTGIIIGSYDDGFIAYNIKYYDRKDVISTDVNVDEVQKFAEFANRCHKDDVKLFLLYMPEYKYGVKYDNADKVKIIKSVIGDIAIQNGAKILDYNDDMVSDVNLDITKYSDWLHLNYSGAIIFSNMLRFDIYKYLK